MAEGSHCQPQGEDKVVYRDMLFCSNYCDLQLILLKGNYTRSRERKKVLPWACSTETENYFIVVTALANSTEKWIKLAPFFFFTFFFKRISWAVRLKIPGNNNVSTTSDIISTPA